MRQKIWHKADQSSADHPNLLIIKLEDDTHRYQTPEEWIAKLDPTLQKCQEVAAIWITFHDFGDLQKIVQPIGKHYQVTRTELYALGSQSLLIFNSHYKRDDFPATTWQPLFEHFM